LVVFDEIFNPQLTDITTWFWWCLHQKWHTCIRSRVIQQFKRPEKFTAPQWQWHFNLSYEWLLISTPNCYRDTATEGTNSCIYYL